MKEKPRIKKQKKVILNCAKNMFSVKKMMNKINTIQKKYYLKNSRAFYSIFVS